MVLKYSDDEVTDEEMRGLNLQTAAQQYINQGYYKIILLTSVTHQTHHTENSHNQSVLCM